MIALDTSAACDTINHSTLLSHISKTVGVRGTALTWLESYLNGQHRYVKVGQNQSVTALSAVEAPQGSVFDSNLFLIYISPIMNIALASGVNIHHFADDTKLYAYVNRNDEKLSIDAVEKFSAAVNDSMLHNGLTLNTDKSEAICFEPVQPLLHQ